MSNFSPYQIPTLALPTVGPLAVDVPLEFGGDQIVNVDLTSVLMNSDFQMVQAIYVDNADNSAPLDFFFYGSPVAQRLRVPAYSQGVWPLLWPVQNGRFRAVGGQGLTINAKLLNTALPFLNWGPQDGALVVPPLLNIGFDPLAIVAGDNQLVAGAGGQTIRLYRGIFNVDQPANILIRAGSGGTVIMSAALTAGGSLTLQGSGVAWGACPAGVDLILESDANTNLYGGFGYVQD